MPLPVLLVPFAAVVVVAVVADWIWPSLVTDKPLLLIALSSKNRYLLLTAPQLGFAAFFVVGFLRLLLTDPLTYQLGRQYGEEALTWLERTSSAPPGASFIRKAERAFGRAAPVFVFVAPSAIGCVLAGAARMKLRLFITCNLLGTLTRLAFFWMAADVLREPLEDVLVRIDGLQVPLLLVTTSLGALHIIRSRRRRSSRNTFDPPELTTVVLIPDELPAS